MPGAYLPFWYSQNLFALSLLLKFHTLFQSFEEEDEEEEKDEEKEEKEE